jgi:hypothetical protein
LGPISNYQLPITNIELEAAGQVNPWLKFAGMWTNDPSWDEFLAEVAAYRQEIEQADPEA